MSIKFKSNAEDVKPGHYFLLEGGDFNVEETVFELRMTDSTSQKAIREKPLGEHQP